VNLFFVISGYVLSYRSLSVLYASDYPKMHEGTASSMFQRALRLWLPTMAAILLIAFLTQTRAFESAKTRIQTPEQSSCQGLLAD
jgi:peptidoglycan/LPS O-acetylase OafA/YrhL